MKPILFPEGQKTFNTNGMGRLSDAISCKVTEERNGQYELHMEYPIDGQLIEELRYSRIIYATPADGKSPQPFESTGLQSRFQESWKSMPNTSATI